MPVVSLFAFFEFFFLASGRAVRVADETFVQQFLGSPLLILVALLVIAALASVYHRIRK